MNIIGEKVLLRAIETRDRDMFLEMINDPETERMIGGLSFPVSELEQEQWIRDQAGVKQIVRCVITEKSNPDSGLGTVILSDIDYRNGVAQVHIKLIKNGRGKGFGEDALKTITHYAFSELRLNCVYADVLSYNKASQALFDKCGYMKDGILRARIYKNGKYHDVYTYSRLKNDSES